MKCVIFYSMDKTGLAVYGTTKKPLATIEDCINMSFYFQNLYCDDSFVGLYSADGRNAIHYFTPF